MPTLGCVVCSHADREKIDLHLAEGRTLALMQEIFHLPLRALREHRERHLTGLVVRVGTDPVTIHRAARDLVGFCEQMIERTDDSDPKMMELRLRAIESARKCLETEAQLSGMGKHFDPKMLIPYWQQLRQAIIDALQPYPEAEEAVLQAIENVQGQWH